MIYLILATCSSAAMAIVLKLFQNQKGNRFGILLGNYLVCILISILRLEDRSTIFAGSPVTLLCGVIGGILFVAGLVTLQTSIRVNGATLSAVYAKLGMVVSIGISIIAFGERPGPVQIVGILLVVAAIVLINGDTGGKDAAKTEIDSKILLLTMLAAGGASSMPKIFEEVGSREEDTLFFLYLFATAAVLVVFLIIWEKKRTGDKLLWQEMAAGIAVGIPNYYASFLLLPALVVLPAFFVYPVYSTGTILIVSVVGAMAFHERHNARQKAGIGLILVSLVLLNM